MSGSKRGESQFLPVSSSSEIRHLVGPVADDTVAAILECGASAEDLEVAARYLRGEGDEVDRLGHPMMGRIAQLYDILIADDLYANGEP